MRMGYEKVELVMRIISQSGSVDLPYEKVCLYIDSTLIIASCDNAKYMMGSYRNNEEAVKHMEMCREKYGQCKANEILLTGTGSRFECHPIDFENVAKTNVFQFPQDE